MVQSPVARGALALVCLTTLTGFASWFGRPLVNGYYVSRGGVASIIMVRLVEAPRGHLSGALVVTAVDQSSSAPGVTRRTLQGSIAGGNITLRTPGLFGLLSAVYVGTLDGDRLTLSLQGHSPFTLYLTSATGYQDRLAALQRIQSNINATLSAMQSVKNAAKLALRLHAALERYIAWGQERIARQTGVRLWWAKKAKYYDACLATIRKLDADGVWTANWGPCPETVLYDYHARDREVADIRTLQQQDAAQVSAIQQLIIEVPLDARAAQRQLQAVCPSAPHPKACNQYLWRFVAAEPTLVPASEAATFHALAPRVANALADDAEVGDTTNPRLAHIATEIKTLYWTR
jgi:hypothetical protein